MDPRRRRPKHEEADPPGATLRYHDDTGQLDMRATLTGDTAAELGATNRAVLGQPADAYTGENGVGDALRARGGSRTRTPLGGSRF